MVTPNQSTRQLEAIRVTFGGNAVEVAPAKKSPMAAAFPSSAAIGNQPRYSATTLPGFIMLSGSSACLILRMYS